MVNEVKSRMFGNVGVLENVLILNQCKIAKIFIMNRGKKYKEIFIILDTFLYFQASINFKISKYVFLRVVMQPRFFCMSMCDSIDTIISKNFFRVSASPWPIIFYKLNFLLIKD